MFSSNYAAAMDYEDESRTPLEPPLLCRSPPLGHHIHDTHHAVLMSELTMFIFHAVSLKHSCALDDLSIPRFFERILYVSSVHVIRMDA